uniref:ORF99 n=1 Tax=Acidianus filamentous virus 1 TaxID=235266 RepID=UPI0001A5EF81
GDTHEFHKLLIKVVDLFLEDRIKEFEMKLNTTLDELEFEELIGKPDSSNSAENNGIFIDEYSYDASENAMKKLFVEYVRQPEFKYTVLSIKGVNDWVRE